MPIVSVIHQSNTGHTTRLAEAVADGARSLAGIEVHPLAVRGDDIVRGRWENAETLARLDESDAIVFGTPTNMGDVSGPMKCFLDATSSRFYPRAWADKLAAGFTSSFYPSGDKLHALLSLVIFAMQHGMIWIGHNEAGFDEVAPNGYCPTRLNRLGGWAGVMGTAHPWEPVERSPEEADLSAARALGRRVGEAAVRWAGRVSTSSGSSTSSTPWTRGAPPATGGA